ncbi:hypothetical protein SLA2020_361900 [Shorea laevis]
MPKSSRHKSGKHSSKDVRDYSDSEKDSSLKEKERKPKEESSGRVYKESGSGEKRKLDSKDGSKDPLGSGNGEYLEDYSSSKRRKERVDDGVSDRWNGGDDDGRGEKKPKVSSESKSKRREELEGDDLKKSKSEGKHRESSRRDDREREKERDRKVKDGKAERFLDGEEYRAAKQATEKAELDAQDQLQSPESESQLERQVRRKRDGPGDMDKHQEDDGDTLDRQLSLRNDICRDGRPKDEKYKDEKYRDKYREDADREERYRDDKLRDERFVRDRTNGRSSDKHSRDDKDATEIRQKKSKTQDSDRDRERELDRDRDRDHDVDIGHDRDRDRHRDRDYYRERERNRDRDYDRDWDRDLERDWDRDRDRDREHDRDRNRDRDRDRRENDRDRDRDRDRDVEYDGSYLDDRNARHKDSRGRKRSPEDHDDIYDTKAKGVKSQFSEMETKSLSSSRVESDADRGRSTSRQAHFDAVVGGNKRRTSPSSSSLAGTDDYRHVKPEDLKYRDPGAEQRSKRAAREVTGFSGSSERGSKYRTVEKSSKVDDHMGELPTELSSSSKASPVSLIERSPSSTSFERRSTRAGGRWSLDVEETGWRGSASAEDRANRELPFEKPYLDESSQDPAFYNKSNSSMNHPPPAFRPGHGSPSFMGSMEEDNRINISARYKRSGDPNVGRGQGNAWRGGPNWAAPVPNGFIPFQHGPPHGGFQTMMPPFPSPSLFSVRASMDINHAGIPFHIPDAERFSGHMRPIGWPNMMDGSGPSHLHGWDGNNVFRDEPHMYGGPEWEHNRHPMNGRGWDANSDVWKGQNGDVDLSSTSHKEDNPVQDPIDDIFNGQDVQKCQYENDQNGQVKNHEIRSSISSPAKEPSKSPPEITHELISDSSKISSDDNSDHFCHVYLSKIDISTELAGLELYGQCMSLLNGEKSEPLVKDAAMLVNLKDGGRAVVKSSIAFSNPSLIPPANNSVFKKALDLYKRDRVEMTGLPPVKSQSDFVSASNLEQREEKGSLHNLEKAPEVAMISDAEMLDAATPNSDQKKAGAISPVASQRSLTVPASVQDDETRDHPESPSQKKLELPNPANVNESLEEPKPVLNGDKVDEVESEQMVVEDVGIDNASQAAVLLTDGECPNNMEVDSSVNCPKERQAIDDAISGSLFLSDGSPKVSGTLIMPGSNESESVILSRIHHSPESTH